MPLHQSVCNCHHISHKTDHSLKLVLSHLIGTAQYQRTQHTLNHTNYRQSLSATSQNWFYTRSQKGQKVDCQAEKERKTVINCDRREWKSRWIKIKS
jgi:hypothetical protein